MSGGKLHYEVTRKHAHGQPYGHPACGSYTRRRTKAVDDVTCLQCKATDAYKRAAAGPTEKDLMRAELAIAKDLLARAHGILELDESVKKLPAEIAAFLWPVPSELPSDKRSEP